MNMSNRTTNDVEQSSNNIRQESSRNSSSTDPRTTVNHWNSLPYGLRNTRNSGVGERNSVNDLNIFQDPVPVISHHMTTFPFFPGMVNISNDEDGLRWDGYLFHLQEFCQGRLGLVRVEDVSMRSVTDV